MALSVRLDPQLEARVEQESRRLGITKTAFVCDALERVLGLKNPYELLRQVRPVADSTGKKTARSEATGEKFRASLRAKRVA